MSVDDLPTLKPTLIKTTKSEKSGKAEKKVATKKSAKAEKKVAKAEKKEVKKVAKADKKAAKVEKKVAKKADKVAKTQNAAKNRAISLSSIVASGKPESVKLDLTNATTVAPNLYSAAFKAFTASYSAKKVKDSLTVSSDQSKAVLSVLASADNVSGAVAAIAKTFDKKVDSIVAKNVTLANKGKLDKVGYAAAVAAITALFTPASPKKAVKTERPTKKKSK